MLICNGSSGQHVPIKISRIGLVREITKHLGLQMFADFGYFL